MHELGIVFQIVNTLEKVVEEENLPAVDTVVLQVGQLSGVIPIYLDECWEPNSEGGFDRKHHASSGIIILSKDIKTIEFFEDDYQAS